MTATDAFPALTTPLDDRPAPDAGPFVGTAPLRAVPNATEPRVYRDGQLTLWSADGLKFTYRVAYGQLLDIVTGIRNGSRAFIEVSDPDHPGYRIGHNPAHITAASWAFEVYN